MKKLFLLLSFVAIGFLFSSCDESTTEPEAQKGAIYVISVPSGAQIWLDGQNQNKVTPDSLTNLDAGTYQVTLKMTGYRDTTVSVTVTAGLPTPKTVVLTSSVSLVEYGPVKIYETYNTGATQPSGLSLSTGQAVSSSSTATDVLYYTNSTFTVHEIRSSSSRTAYFQVGNSTNLNDGVSSPVKTSSWAAQMSDTETNYVFIYDFDGHYSKLKIVNVSSITDVPAWIEVEWIYNKTVNDVRF